MSMGGGGIGGGGRVPPPSGREGGDVQQPGIEGEGTGAPNVGELEGLAEIEGGEDIENAEALAKAKQHQEVHKDGYGKVVKDLSLIGPEESQGGFTPLEQELIEGIPLNPPPDPAKVKEAEKTHLGTPNFETAVSAMQDVYENPTPENIGKAAAAFSALDTGDVNIMEILFLVFRESIKETNEDKKYFLMKLQEFNEMGEQLSDYLHYLVNESRELGARAAGAKYPDMVMTAGPVHTKQFDLSGLSQDGKLVAKSSQSKPLDRQGLNDTIKEVESMQETVRNKRQMASTAFQNFDQKANQLYNLMASVMKAFNEMRSGTVRNML